MRVVLDSNVLVSSLGKRSRLKPIWQAFIQGRFQLIISEHIIKEYEEIIQLYSAPGAAEIVMEILIESTAVITKNVFYNWNIITADAEDNKFFDVAVAADADYLVTNDRHFDIAKTINFPKVNIITADEFLNILTRS